jgi:EAL domain-containing protein (putative c-di-GMP-specific phosphodiesterase class I)
VKKSGIEQTLRYYDLLDQLVSAMTAVGDTDVPLIESILEELSRLFRLCKGVIRLYRSLDEEKEGGGETLCSFNIGEGEPVAFQRVVTSIMSVATMTVYMQPGVRPLTSEERRRVELIMRLVLSFTSRNRIQSTIESLAFYDDYGYRNMRSLFNHFRKMKEMDRLAGLTVIRYNLRHFSLVNQELGREKANLVLRNHYKQMEELADGEGMVCRPSGDDFVAVCRQERLEEALAFLTEARIPYGDAEGKTATVSANAGVFVIPEGFELNNVEDVRGPVIASFMAAMSGKKGQIVFYNEELAHEREKVTRVQQSFADALREEEFYPVYQPKVDIRTGKICGAEALCRWNHKGEAVFPNDFIPALEETSEVCRLDFYMLEHVCRQIRQWLDKGLSVVRISVNLSRKHMLNRNLLADLVKIVDSCRVPHRYIEFEFTETTTDVEFSDLRRIVSGMQQEDFCAAVDDYGMGYSSLNLIKNIPWNVLKIDRSVLPANNEDYRGKHGIMLKHVVAMFKELGLECVAEGVETENQLKLLKETSCDLVQGYLFYKPLSAEEFEKKLAEQN